MKPPPLQSAPGRPEEPDRKALLEGLMAQERNVARGPVPTRDTRRKRGRWPAFISGDDAEYLVTDLSAKGCFLRELVHLAPGTHVWIELSLTRGSIRTGATVRWVRPRRLGPAQVEGTGLLFDELAPAARAALDDELEQEGA